MVLFAWCINPEEWLYNVLFTTGDPDVVSAYHTNLSYWTIIQPPLQ